MEGNNFTRLYNSGNENLANVIPVGKPTVISVKASVLEKASADLNQILNYARVHAGAYDKSDWGRSEYAYVLGDSLIPGVEQGIEFDFEITYPVQFYVIKEQ